jgi:NAD(P)-dependent dehydrogenase (short-subunit alcohol dehydrogenase family)
MRTPAGGEDGVEGAGVLVVGGSSGLGRCIGIGLARKGATVAFCGRRGTLLDEAAAEAGNSSFGIACDATDEATVAKTIDQVAERLGALDGLVYAAGIGPLVRLADAPADLWRRVFDVNVVGAAQVTRAALPHLRRRGGSALYLSSVSASLTAPWPGLGPYAASKAALDKMVEAWRVEHPDVGFTRVVVGDTAGGDGASATQFASGWDPELAGELLPRWVASGLVVGSLIDPDDLVDVVAAVIQSRASIPSVAVVPRPPS